MDTKENKYLNLLAKVLAKKSFFKRGARIGGMGKRR